MFIAKNGMRIFRGAGRQVAKSWAFVSTRAGLGRIFKLAFNGWMIYDIGQFAYESIWGDSEAEKRDAHDWILDQFLSPEISAALGYELSDSAAVSHAYAAKSIRFLENTIDAEGIKGLAYAALSVYLREYPFGRLAFSPTEIETVIVNETQAFLIDEVNPPLTADQSAQIKAEMVLAFEELDIQQAEYAQIRPFDFIAYVINDLAESQDVDTSGNPLAIPFQPLDATDDFGA